MENPSVEAMDWAALSRLRENFLKEGSGDYWASETTLQLYDQSFGRRIAWKWNAVLDELEQRGWSPPQNADLLDWGCGTAVASQAILKKWALPKAYLWDRSSLATNYSQKKLKALYPKTETVVCTEMPKLHHPTLLLLSHVLNELSASSLQHLMRWAVQAHTILWVEPGLASTSRQLSQARETLKKHFSILAPCPHPKKPCGVLETGKEAFWCHFFAPSPQEAFHTQFWAEFSKRLRIDMRSLPLSFLVLSKEKKAPPNTAARVLGRPRPRKGYCSVDICTAQGVHSRKVFRKHAPEIYKDLRKPRFSRWLSFPE